MNKMDNSVEGKEQRFNPERSMCAIIGRFDSDGSSESLFPANERNRRFVREDSVFDIDRRLFSERSRCSR